MITLALTTAEARQLADALDVAHDAARAVSRLLGSAVGFEAAGKIAALKDRLRYELQDTERERRRDEPFNGGVLR